jgi:phage virion morphogenesis protein
MSNEQAKRSLEMLYRTLDEGGRRKIMREIVTVMRREQSQRIAKQTAPDGSRYPARSIRDQKNQTRGPMFRKIRLVRNMDTRYDSNEGSVGIARRLSGIANVHQTGGKAIPRKGMSPVQYPIRELIGISKETENIVLAAFEKALLK